MKLLVKKEAYLLAYWYFVDCW